MRKPKTTAGVTFRAFSNTWTPAENNTTTNSEGQKKAAKKKKNLVKPVTKTSGEKVLAADSCCTEALQRQRWAPAYTCFGSRKGTDTSSIMPE